MRNRRACRRGPPQGRHYGKFGSSPAVLAFAVLSGPMILAALAILCWVAGGRVPPALVARIGTGVLLLWIGLQLRTVVL